MNNQKVEIEYALGQDAYKVVLTAASLDVFTAAAENPDILGLTGEKLVAALVDFAAGGITGIERYKNGKLNDGPAGEPAIIVLQDGHPRHVRLYQDGKLRDGKNGEPASQDFVVGVLMAATTYAYNNPKIFRQLTRLEVKELPETIEKNKRDAAQAAYWRQVKFSGPK